MMVNTPGSKLMRIIFAAFFVMFCFTNKANAQQRFYKNVDPYIGTDGHGHTFMGASVPHGAVQVDPANIGKGWCSITYALPAA